MNVIRRNTDRVKRSTCVFLVFLLALLFYPGRSLSQESGQAPFSPVVDIKLLSAEITRFDKRIRIGVGKRTIEYQEALVLKVLANREKFDSLPPSIEPFLYVGRHEYRMFHIDRDDERKELILTFHIRNWEELEDRAPVVLTIDHGGPIRDPRRFLRRASFRLSKEMIIDKR